MNAYRVSFAAIARSFGFLCRSFSVRTGIRETQLIASKPKPSVKVVAAQGCPICRNGLERFGYRDVLLLRQFLSRDGYILNRRQTGVCPRMQRRVARSIRRSRQRGLLPNFSLPKEKQISKTLSPRKKAKTANR